MRVNIINHDKVIYYPKKMYGKEYEKYVDLYEDLKSKYEPIEIFMNKKNFSIKNIY